MINEKKIEEAAMVYFNKNIDKWFDNGSFIQTSDAESIAHPNFYEGANWAIKEFLKGLWHDASEEPKKDANCLVYISCEYGATPENNYKEYITSMYLGGDWSLGCFPPEVDVYPIKWCYLDDILPQKGGEK